MRLNLFTGRYIMNIRSIPNLQEGVLHLMFWSITCICFMLGLLYCGFCFKSHNLYREYLGV